MNNDQEWKRKMDHQTASQSSVKSRSLSEKKGEEQGEAQFNEEDHLNELEIRRWSQNQRMKRIGCALCWHLLYLVSPGDRGRRGFPTPQA